MSEDVVTLMIAVVCANLSYCLRIRHQTLKNINIWKDDVVTNNDKKVDLKVIKESVIVFVDAGAVTGKYMRFFEKIKNNRNINEVNHLATQLQEMVNVDEIPEELEQAYLLAQKLLDSGKKARNAWLSAIGSVEEKFDDAQESNNLYNALVALENLRAISFTNIFDDNGYDYDEESKLSIQKLNNDITVFIGQIIEYHVSTMYCKSVEGINTFRNHNTKIETKLKDLGFFNFSEMVRKKKEAELGKDAVKIVSTLTARLEELSKAKERINKDMSDIWDDLFEVKSSEDIEDLIDRISMVLQKGISNADKSDFSELKENLQELLTDINQIKEATKSRKTFIIVSEKITEKYVESDFDFEVQPILKDVIEEIAKELDTKEQSWKQSNLTLGDKSRTNVHKWKEKIKILPEFLSEDTIAEVQELEKEADEIISEGKIEDVLFYFEKLDSGERKLCINKLLAITD